VPGGGADEKRLVGRPPLLDLHRSLAVDARGAAEGGGDVFTGAALESIKHIHFQTIRLIEGIIHII
jgi:hypothetical protein